MMERRQFDVDDQLPRANLDTTCLSPDSRHGRLLGVGYLIMRHRSACTLSNIRVCCSSRTPPESEVRSATAKEIMFGDLTQFIDCTSTACQKLEQRMQAPTLI